MIKTDPPPLRQASTVILVREKNKALEVYLLRRSNQSGFMGGLYVFPGGVVEPEDRGIETWAPFLDLAPEEVENRLAGKGFPLEDALGFGVAAIRETLEEAGVLMASRKNKTPEDFLDIKTHRMTPDLPNSWFQTRIMNQNWILTISDLSPWSHWITPKLMKKRFDTRFYIVSMPEDQTCSTDNWETKQGLWITPQKALENNLETIIPLSPPTVVTLTQLCGFKDLYELKTDLKTRTWGAPISPCLVPCPNGPVILEPWDPSWERGEEIDFSALPQKILAPGENFSRIWCDQGVWKPVGL